MVEQHTPGIISIQIENRQFIDFFDKLIVSVHQLKGVSPYQGQNDTEKMVDMIKNQFKMEIVYLSKLITTQMK